MKAYVAGAWIEQHQRARPMITRLRAAGIEITCDWTVAEGDVCACGHRWQEHDRFTTDKGPAAALACAHKAPDGGGGVNGFDCGCTMFNGIGVGGDSQLTNEARAKYAEADLVGVMSADVMVLLAANDKGACGSWVELGAAITTRRLTQALHPAGASVHPYIIVAGPKNRRTIFTELADLLVDTDDLAFRAVMVYAGTGQPGWACSNCFVFNGEMKAKRDECRACGVART